MSGQSDIFIHSISFYLPPFRLPRDAEAKQTGVKGKGAKPVCGPDEDTVTMGYESATRTLETWQKTPDAVVFVSSSPEYVEGSSALVVANALDLPSNTLCIDIVGGGASFVSAVEVSKALAREGKSVLLVASEKRMSANIGQDIFFADGSVSAVVSDKNSQPKGTTLKIKEISFVSEQTFDFYRESSTKFAKAQDERHIATVQLPYLAKKLGVGKKALTSAPSFQTKRSADKLAGLEDDLKVAGVFGVAHPLLSLLYNLSKFEKDVEVFSFGAGAGKIKFEVVQKDERETERLLSELESGKPITFGTYLRFRGITEKQVPEEENSVPMLWREKNLRLHGQECQNCKNTQFPKQRYCIVCGSSSLKEKKLSKKGKVFTFTEDYLTHYADINPPTRMLVVELEGGGRIYVQGTDGESFRPGDKVILTLRVLNTSDGWKNYWWKAKKPKEALP